MRDLLTGRIISISLSNWWVGPQPASPRRVWPARPRQACPIPTRGNWNPIPSSQLTIIRPLAGLGVKDASALWKVSGFVEVLVGAFENGTVYF